MSTIHAVILAGGLGSRLGGVRKADLRIGGRRLLDRVADQLIGLSSPLLVSVGRSEGMALPQGAVGLRDAADASLGPLAGLQAAAQCLADVARPSDIVISVAVDTPFLPADYLVRLAALQGKAAYAQYGATPYPTNAAWRYEHLVAALARHPRDAGPRALLRDLSAQPVDWSIAADRDPFANINTLADLLALQRRAARAECGPSQAENEKIPPKPRAD